MFIISLVFGPASWPGNFVGLLGNPISTRPDLVLIIGYFQAHPSSALTQFALYQPVEYHAAIRVAFQEG
jgi:hypothetical protein